MFFPSETLIRPHQESKDWHLTARSTSTEMRVRYTLAYFSFTKEILRMVYFCILIYYVENVFLQGKVNNLNLSYRNFLFLTT